MLKDLETKLNQDYKKQMVLVWSQGSYCKCRTPYRQVDTLHFDLIGVILHQAELEVRCMLGISRKITNGTFNVITTFNS